MNECVITGIGLVTSLGDTVQENYSKICANQTGIKEIKGISTENCYTNLGAEITQITMDGEPEEGLSILSKTNKGFTVDLQGNTKSKNKKYFYILRKALDDAVKDAKLLDNSRIVILNATCSGDSDRATQIYNKDSIYNNKDFNEESITDRTFDEVIKKSSLCLVPPDNVITISTACSSGTVALYYAYNLIASGKEDRVVVIGADVLSDVHFSGFLSLKALDTKPCAPLSNPNGLTLGEGAAAIILESEKAAKERKADWYCYLDGGAISSEAHHITAPDSTGESQLYTMQKALEDAKFTVKAVDYIYTHGTGTIANDTAESLAIEKLTKDIDKFEGPYVSSSKSALGHTLGVSGIINAVLATRMFYEGTLLPTVGFSGEGINKNVNYIRQYETFKMPNVILCNSFAFGGNDASIVLSRKQKYPEGWIDNIIEDPIEVLSWDLYTNLYKNPEDFIDINCLPEKNLVVPSAKDFLNCGIDVNNLRKMDLYSRVKSVSGIRALKKAGIEVTESNCYEIGILGSSEIGTPTAIDSTYGKIIYEKGNNWGDAGIFPNSVYNAGDGWLSINTGIKGACLSVIEGLNGFPMCYNMVSTLFDMHKVNILLLSYCDIKDDKIMCCSIVLGRAQEGKEVKYQWDRNSSWYLSSQQLMRKIIKRTTDGHRE